MSKLRDLELRHVDAATRAEIEARIAYFLALARTRVGLDLRVPSYDVALRGVAAGKADLQRWHLHFNPQLLNENREHFMTHTVGHEVAHLVVYARWGANTKPHGSEWRAVMDAFGLPPRATHRYDVSRLRGARSPYVYRCRCDGDVRLGPLRHTRIRRGVVYFCRRCRAALEYVRRCDS